MYLSRWAVLVQTKIFGQTLIMSGKLTEQIIVSVIIAALFLLYHPTDAHAEGVDISILFGDSHTKTAIDVVKYIKKEYPAIAGKVGFNIYTRNTISGVMDREKTIFILFLMNRKVVEKARPYIESVIKGGGKVYGVSEPYDREDKETGIIADEDVRAYFKENGFENIKNMLLFIMNRDLGLHVNYESPKRLPDFGIYLRNDKKIVETFDEFMSFYHRKKGRWIGLTFYKNSFDSDNTGHIDAIIDSLEAEGFNVLPVYGWPSQGMIEGFFFDEHGKSRVRLVIAVSLKMGINPETMIPVLERLDVPVIDAISLYSQSEQEWRESSAGLDIFERTWQIAIPELGGIVQPMVVASKEKVTDKDTGIEYIKIKPIPGRIKRLKERVRSWVNLQDKVEKEKRVAIIFYNYPPGKQNIGASYLKVLPDSLWEILKKLKAEGYDTGDRSINKDILFNDIFSNARNIGNWARGEIDRVVRRGNSTLIPLKTYKRWFKELPGGFREEVLKSWGTVEESSIMIWQDEQGEKQIVIPGVRYGNILFTPQPARGWLQDVKKLYDDVTLPPHHQYIAFYLYLKKGFKADAVVHVGTHGTHEWLSGKEAGFTGEDSPEVLIQDIPNIYPYIVDDVGEGIQAKRRGMALVIDHMTPPFDRAGLNRELRELSGLISDYNVAMEKNPSLAGSKLMEINNLAEKTGILTALGLKEVKPGNKIEMIIHYIPEIAGELTPFGLHTLGQAPDEKYRRSTAEAIISIEKELSREERKRRIAEIEERILKSAKREIDLLAAALSGRYITAGPGNDPVRNPDSLPTGRNFYAFDPAKIPSKATYEVGVKLAKELIEGYKERHGAYPDKLTFNLWAVETIRNEGVMESQILCLMGIGLKRDQRGRVTGVEAIQGEELGRHRIDVTMIPSGLYRDLFSNLMELLDKAVTIAKEQDEKNNILRANVFKTKEILLKKGIPEDEAERLASVRIFTEPSGAYGTGLSEVISKSDTWDKEEQVADVFFRRMGYLYGQGFRGKKIVKGDDISLALLKNALSGSKMVVHSRSGNLYATLDNDDVFQYLGGTAMAVRSIDGKTPEVYITNTSGPAMPKQESIKRFMGREMMSRYLNPVWIKAMMKEGYAGARVIDKVVEYLWGWQVTVPEAVGADKWQQMYETYVLDKNGLNVKEMFREAKNLWAYQSMTARMLEVIRKGYWKADQEVVETLAKEYAGTIKEAMLTCCDHTCNNPLLTEFIKSVLLSIPGLEGQAQDIAKALKDIKNPPVNRADRINGLKPEKADARSSAPRGESETVEGLEMEDVNNRGSSSAPIPYLFLAGFLLFLVLITLGWKRKKM